MFNTLDDIKLESYEYGFLVAGTSYRSPTFKIWMPKLLPLTNGATERKNNVAIDNNIFINDVKPQTPTTIATRNFLTIPKFKQADFEFKVDDADKDVIIKKGAKFMIAIMNSNIKDMYVTDNI